MATTTTFRLRPDLRIDLSVAASGVMLEIFEGFEENMLRQLERQGFRITPPAGSLFVSIEPSTTEPSGESPTEPQPHQVIQNERLDGLRSTAVHLSKSQARSLASALMGTAAEI